MHKTAWLGGDRRTYFLLAYLLQQSDKKGIIISVPTFPTRASDHAISQVVGWLAGTKYLYAEFEVIGIAISSKTVTISSFPFCGDSGETKTITTSCLAHDRMIRQKASLQGQETSNPIFRLCLTALP